VAASSRFPVHLIPDDGTRYVPEERVRVDHSTGQIRVIKDPNGEYEVVSCRPATEYGGDPPLLRIGLRKYVRAQVDESGPSSWRHSYDR
jgi:hypothetical protein